MSIKGNQPVPSCRFLHLSSSSALDVSDRRGCSDDHDAGSERRGERSSTEVRGRLKPPLPFRLARTFTLRAFEQNSLSRLPYLARCYLDHFLDLRIRHRENPSALLLPATNIPRYSTYLYVAITARTIRAPSACLTSGLLFSVGILSRKIPLSQRARLQLQWCYSCRVSRAEIISRETHLVRVRIRILACGYGQLFGLTEN